MKKYRIIQKTKYFKNGVTSKRFFIQEKGVFGWVNTKLRIYYPREFEKKEKYYFEKYDFFHLNQAEAALQILKLSPIIYKGVKVTPYIEAGNFACWWVTSGIFYSERNRFKNIKDFFSWVDSKTYKEKEMVVFI